jgi:hypothetical protein
MKTIKFFSKIKNKLFFLYFVDKGRGYNTCHQCSMYSLTNPYDDCPIEAFKACIDHSGIWEEYHPISTLLEEIQK